MGEGFRVVTEELAHCGRRVSSMSSQAESLRGRATAAEVPSRSWGLLGELTTHSKYADLQNQLTDHLSAMTTGLDNAGQRISNTADLYRETDERHKKEISDAGGDEGRNDPGKADPGRSGGSREGSPVDGGPHGGSPHGGGDPGSGGPSRGGSRVGSPGSGSPGGGVRHVPDMHGGDSRSGLPPQTPTTSPDPGMVPDPSRLGDGHQNVHGKITVAVEGGGPVTVEVTGEAQEDIEVKGDIQQADGRTEHVDVHAETDSAGHAKVALKDTSYQHLSGTLLPNTAEEQA